MGKTSSKYESTSHQYSVAHTQNIYQTNVRSYAKWDHGQVLASNDINRFVTSEMQNRDKHKHLTTPIPVQVQANQAKIHKSSSNNYIRPPESHHDQNRYQTNALAGKTRSNENLLKAPRVVTAEQLLYGSSAGRGHRSQSPSQISVQSDQMSTISKSSSSGTKTKKKKVPRDVTFVSINPKDLQVNEYI